MVRAMAAAAGGQARIITQPEYRGQGSDPEDQSEKDGQSTPHLQMMLYEEHIHSSTIKTNRLSGIIELSLLLESLQQKEPSWPHKTTQHLPAALKGKT
jgi:hypothetical protein